MESWPQFLNSRDATLRAQNLSRDLRTFAGAGVHLSLNARPVVSFASNDYLGLSTHPNVIAATCAATKSFGAGSTASALICGHKTIHAELCAALAAFKGAERALLFPSGYQAALGVLSALGEDAELTAIILDKLSHASLIDGARLSGARVRSFAHNDLAECAALLVKESARRCIVVVESLYSMDGDLAPLAELVRLAESHGALLLVDEAHSTGTLGPSARGGLELNGFAALPEHVIALGTLSKALGAQGGFVCASEQICRALLTARPHMFSTALNPGSAGAALAALKLLPNEVVGQTFLSAGPGRQECLPHLKHNAEFIRAAARSAGLDSPSTAGPIVPIMIGDEARALDASQRLLDAGFLVPAIRFPTVKRGAARLRISVSAAHTEEECAGLMRALTTGGIES